MHILLCDVTRQPALDFHESQLLGYPLPLRFVWLLNLDMQVVPILGQPREEEQQGQEKGNRASSSSGARF